MRKRPPFAAIVDQARLLAWIEAGWISPRSAPSERPQLSEVDLARAQLICDLQDDLGVNDEGVEVILDLLDQLYGLRQAVRDMIDTMIDEAKK